MMRDMLSKVSMGWQLASTVGSFVHSLIRQRHPDEKEVRKGTAGMLQAGGRKPGVKRSALFGGVCPNRSRLAP